MRRLVPFAILAAVLVGCGDSKSTGVNDPKAATAKFDPDSAENTLAWCVEFYLKDLPPKNNDAAHADWLKKYGRDVETATKGKAVRWRMPVEKVDADGNVYLHSIEQNVPTSAPGEPTRYRLGVSAETAKGKGDLGGSDTRRFPTSPPKAEWVKKVGSGGTVIVVGKIAAGGGVAPLKEANGDVGGHITFVLAEARVEQP